MLSNPPRNMLAQSQSGTGKTAAFVTATLSRVDFTNPDQPQALILAPSRELARQIEGVIKAIGRFVEPLKVAAAIPGALERNAPVRASVIVGTPGTVMDVIRRRQLDVSQLRVLVLDEADNMLDQQGLGDQCLRVKKCVTSYAMLPRFKLTSSTACFPRTFKFCSFRPHFPTKLTTMLPNSHRMPISLNCSVVSSQSRESRRCSSTVRMITPSTIFSASSTA